MVGHQYTCSEDIKDAFQDVGFAITERAMNPLYHPNFIYRLTSLCHKVNYSYELLKEMFKPIMDRRKKVLEFGNEKRTFIDELIKMDKDGKIWTDELVEQNFMAIILAVSEILFKTFRRNERYKKSLISVCPVSCRFLSNLIAF